MNDKQFEELVENAINNIPDIYADKLNDVVFKIEDQPTTEQRTKLGLRKCDALFGLYEGIPLTSRNGVKFSKVPDVITIFKHPMVDIFADEQSLQKQVYETVWHEVAHFFGLDHKQINKAKKN
jgi:predicted Zn-dependent protease with MMP-like domain